MSAILPPHQRLPWDTMAGVVMARGEADVLLLNLSRLISHGLRRFVVADHGSSDGLADMVRELFAQHSDVQAIVIEDPIAAFRKQEKMTALCSVAHHYFGAEWIFPFDADDFLWLAPGPVIRLHDGLDYIDLPWLQQHPATSPFDRMTPDLAATRLLATHATPESKVLFRWRPSIVLQRGQHAVERSSGRSHAPIGVHGADLGIASVHYPIRSPKQIEDKIERARSAVVGDDPDTAMHWRGAIKLADDRDALRQFVTAFWTRDRASFERLCHVFSIEPHRMSYLYDMVAREPEPFPATEPCGIEQAQRVMSFRRRRERTFMESVQRRIAKLRGQTGRRPAPIPPLRGGP